MKIQIVVLISFLATISFYSFAGGSVNVLFLKLSSFSFVGSGITDKVKKITSTLTSGLQTRELSAKEFKSEFEKTPNAVLLDVRTPEEFSEGHIDKAINIDFKSSDFEKKLDGLDKNKSYFVYCRSGKRSKGAADLMTKAGFKNVIGLQGGILGWEENHFPVVK